MADDPYLHEWFVPITSHLRVGVRRDGAACLAVLTYSDAWKWELVPLLPADVDRLRLALPNAKAR